MKKIISLAICVLMVCALCIPTFAAVAPLTVRMGNSKTISEDGQYSSTTLAQKATLTIDNGATVTVNGAMKIQDTSALVLNGKFTGTVTSSSISEDATITLGSNGCLDLTGTSADAIAPLKKALDDRNIACQYDEATFRLTAGSLAETGSTLSSGNIAIIAVVAVAAIGVVAVLIVTKKKKSSANA